MKKNRVLYYQLYIHQLSAIVESICNNYPYNYDSFISLCERLINQSSSDNDQLFKLIQQKLADQSSLLQENNSNNNYGAFVTYEGNNENSNAMSDVRLNEDEKLELPEADDGIVGNDGLINANDSNMIICMTAVLITAYMNKKIKNNLNNSQRLKNIINHLYPDYQKQLKTTSYQRYYNLARLTFLANLVYVGLTFLALLIFLPQEQSMLGKILHDHLTAILLASAVLTFGASALGFGFGIKAKNMLENSVDNYSDGVKLYELLDCASHSELLQALDLPYCKIPFFCKDSTNQEKKTLLPKNIKASNKEDNIVAADFGC